MIRKRLIWGDTVNVRNRLTTRSGLIVRAVLITLSGLDSATVRGFLPIGSVTGRQHDGESLIFRASRFPDQQRSEAILCRGFKSDEEDHAAGNGANLTREPSQPNPHNRDPNAIQMSQPRHFHFLNLRPIRR